MQKFTLRSGKVQEFVDETGVKHTISISRFADHDHKQKPIYHPLKEKENPNQLVVTVQSDVDALPSPYPPVYASCVTSQWEVFRGSVVFRFKYHSDDDEYILCEAKDTLPYVT